MLKDSVGNRLFRKVTVRVTFPDAIFPPKTFVQHAGPKQGFGPEGIESILLSVADRLEELYPYWDFTVIELSPEGRAARYAFSFAGYRPMTPVGAEFISMPSTQPQESSALAPEAEVEVSTPTEVGNPPAVPSAPEVSVANQ